ncbi:hypothetical protein T12_18 [Trichinella patagoniensis]|uniref:Uncharacterized protein n=1 Tax=Trichinella patagoniensis TaxID=990121 RepID=A0A0V0YT54_9BILA|nr:hypothetical protein T12_18 [Trichinella patagoniensis]
MLVKAIRAYFIFPQSVDFSFTYVLLRLLCRSYPRSATSASFKMFCEKVFLKEPPRVQQFKEMAPEIPLPPQPYL